jgi:hypothetical protein
MGRAAFLFNFLQNSKHFFGTFFEFAIDFSEK